MKTSISTLVLGKRFSAQWRRKVDPWDVVVMESWGPFWRHEKFWMLWQKATFIIYIIKIMAKFCTDSTGIFVVDGTCLAWRNFCSESGGCGRAPSQTPTADLLQEFAQDSYSVFCVNLASPRFPKFQFVVISLWVVGWPISLRTEGPSECRLIIPTSPVLWGHESCVQKAAPSDVAPWDGAFLYVFVMSVSTAQTILNALRESQRSIREDSNLVFFSWATKVVGLAWSFAKLRIRDDVRPWG